MTCTHDASYCPHCLGSGEWSEDRLDSRGEHYTREHPCRECDGTGRVACAECAAAEERVSL